MTSFFSRWKTPCLAFAFILGGFSFVEAAALGVYTFDYSDTGVAVPPYLSWSNTKVTDSANQGTWLPADQYLAIVTDQRFQSGTWGIQVFTDNVQVANGAQTAPPVNVPDYLIGGTPHSGGTVQGPLTPKYEGKQTTRVYPQANCQGTPKDVIPKSGLISSDGQTRIPLIWRLFNSLPCASGTCPPLKVPAITENPPCGLCDFDGSNCEWFFFQDKGDEYLPTGGGQPVSDWKPSNYYVTPMSDKGSYYSVCPPDKKTAGDCVDPQKPTTVSGGGITTQYLFVASNFRNGIRKVYQTTLFVELYVL